MGVKIGVNFAIEEVGWKNGPMRVVPRRWVLTPQQQPPHFLDEPTAEALGTVALQPLQAGDAVIRDLRLWHSGTPNLADRTRFLPNLELISEEYARYIDDEAHTLSERFCIACSTGSGKASGKGSGKCVLPVKERAKCLPPRVFQQLRRRSQERCISILATTDHEIKTGIRPSFAKLQETWKKGSGKGVVGNKRPIADLEKHYIARPGSPHNVGKVAEAMVSSMARGKRAGTFSRTCNEGKFGFIWQDDTTDGEEMFVLPGSYLQHPGKFPEIGTRLRYDVVVDEKTRKPRAEDVVLEASMGLAGGEMYSTTTGRETLQRRWKRQA